MEHHAYACVSYKADFFAFGPIDEFHVAHWWSVGFLLQRRSQRLACGFLLSWSCKVWGALEPNQFCASWAAIAQNCSYTIRGIRCTRMFELFKIAQWSRIGHGPSHLPIMLLLKGCTRVVAQTVNSTQKCCHWPTVTYFAQVHLIIVIHNFCVIDAAFHYRYLWSVLTRWPNRFGSSNWLCGPLARELLVLCSFEMVYGIAGHATYIFIVFIVLPTSIWCFQ